MNEDVTRARPPRPTVSLLIAVHNRLELTRACLDSVFRCRDTDPFDEIIVVDDCSTDGTGAWLASLADRVRVICNTERGCFGHNMNHAAGLAASEYLLLLNNDTIVTPRFSRAMLDDQMRDPSIGIVGNRQLYPDTGLLNHAGVVFDHVFRGGHLHKGLPGNFAPTLVSREFQAVTGACWLVRRDLFLDLGGFDPVFRNGWEDVDFCLRARQRGWRVWYSANSVIYHHMHASEGRLDDEDANLAYFLEKWRGKVVPDLDAFLIRDGLRPLRRPIEELDGEPGVVLRMLRAIRRHRLFRSLVDVALRVPGATPLADFLARRMYRAS